ncbi:MAG: glycosyl hydrolase [Janthinobacterium lividum]
MYAHPELKYILVLNEPDLSGQSTFGAAQAATAPADAAALWPQYETIAEDAGVQVIGLQITYDTDPNYGNPVTWLDAFYKAYESANGGRQPRIDNLGFHWYDYGLDAQLTTLAPFCKPFGLRSSPTGTVRTMALKSTPSPSTGRR